MKKTLRQEFTKGIWKENPLLVALLGICPALAVTACLQDALAMGIAVIFVLVCSNAIVSMIRGFIEGEINLTSMIVVIASFVTIVELMMKAYAPESINKSLGIFISLIVVNCIILYRATSFASKNNVIRSIADGAGMGIGFTIGLAMVALFRESLGAGTIFGIKISLNFDGLPFFQTPPGAFFALAMVLFVLNSIKLIKKKKRMLERRTI